MTSFETIPLFYFLLPLVAFLYASVGHGGASGYLALMILFSFPTAEMKSTAWILNSCVSAISFLAFLRTGHFRLQLFLMVGIISIPAAYWGGSLELHEAVFKKILGVFLILAVLRLLGVSDRKTEASLPLNKPNLAIALILGASIGFLSGLLGIGGGILLTPALLFLRWTSLKDAAGISALFILVNSVAGIYGQWNEGHLVIQENLTVFILCVVAGGLLGGYLGSSKLNNNALKYLLAAVLLIATYKLFFN